MSILLTILNLITMAITLFLLNLLSLAYIGCFIFIFKYLSKAKKTQSKQRFRFNLIFAIVSFLLGWILTLF